MAVEGGGLDSASGKSLRLHHLHASHGEMRLQLIGPLIARLEDTFAVAQGVDGRCEAGFAMKYPADGAAREEDEERDEDRDQPVAFGLRLRPGLPALDR